MASQSEVRWSQLKVGAIVIVSLMVLVALLFLMTGSNGSGPFQGHITVMSYFQNSNGLAAGGTVTLQGVTIGTVKSVSVSSDPKRRKVPVLVTMRLNTKFAPALKSDTKAGLSTVGVLGDTVVDLTSQFATGGPMQDGQELQTLENPSISDVVKQGQGTIEQLNVILSKLNDIADNLQTGKGSIGQLINNPGLYNKADATVTQLAKLATNLNEGRGSIGKLVTDDELYNRLNGTVSKLQNIADALDKGNGTAGKLLKDETLYNNLNQTIVHANSILADVDAGKGGLGLIVKDPAFAAKLRDTVDSVNAIVAGVQQGKGTLGKLATDDQAYTNLNGLLTESTTLVQAVRRDPKKYLMIQLKIF